MRAIKRMKSVSHGGAAFEFCFCGYFLAILSPIRTFSLAVDLLKNSL